MAFKPQHRTAESSVPVNSFKQGPCRPSEGSPKPHANFFHYIINLTLICHDLLGQEAFFVGSGLGLGLTCFLSGTLRKGDKQHKDELELRQRQRKAQIQYL